MLLERVKCMEANFKLFLDSNIVIETIKKNPSDKHIEARRILELILKKFLFIHSIMVNLVVWDEVIYHLISKGKAHDINFVAEYLKSLFALFDWVDVTEDVAFKALDLMLAYGLKPHDALILSTCMLRKIDFLISLDEDFIGVCEKERIFLVNSADMLLKLLEN